MSSTPFERLWTRFLLRRCASVGRGTVARGTISIRGQGKIFIGEDVVLDGSDSPIELTSVDADAEIHLGDRVLVSGGTSIEAVVSITVGADAILGRFSKVMDTNFHRLVVNRDDRLTARPVSIGERANIGARAVVLAGGDVGADAIVDQRSIVGRRDSVPDDAAVVAHSAVKAA